MENTQNTVAWQKDASGEVYFLNKPALPNTNGLEDNTVYKFVNSDPMTGRPYSLKPISPPTLPDSLYQEDKIKLRSAIVEQSWQKHKEVGKTMAVLFNGVAGSGKTTICKYIIATSQHPVIVVTNTTNLADLGDCIRQLSDVNQQFIVYIDEFEKIINSSMYDDDESIDNKTIHFLKLLEPDYKSSALFLLTSNNMRFSQYFRDRPGRIAFVFEYGEMPIDEVSAYLETHLKPDFVETVKDYFVSRVDKLITVNGVVDLVKLINNYDEEFLKAIGEEGFEELLNSYNIARFTNSSTVNTLEYKIYANDVLCYSSIGFGSPSSVLFGSLKTGQSVLNNEAFKSIIRERGEETDDDTDYTKIVTYESISYISRDLDDKKVGGKTIYEGLTRSGVRVRFEIVIKPNVF